MPLSYVYVACIDYLTLMHVGDRSAATIDAGGVLAEFTGVLVPDGYAGYEHLKAVHAWCGAHHPNLRLSRPRPGRCWSAEVRGLVWSDNQSASRNARSWSCGWWCWSGVVRLSACS